MIKYKPLGIIIVVLIQVIVFAYFVRRDNMKARKTIDLKKEMKLLPITINRISDRGAIFINDSLVINARCKIVDLPKGFDGWATHGPIIDFDTIPHLYRLEDLRVPYELSKDVNCDTVHVSKDGYKLKFLLEKFE